jgi:hypothetical protein
MCMHEGKGMATKRWGGGGSLWKILTERPGNDGKKGTSERGFMENHNHGVYVGYGVTCTTTFPLPPTALKALVQTMPVI